MTGILCSSISIHALREEGDTKNLETFFSRYISIHALREEGDIAHLDGLLGDLLFLSTPSARRATDASPTWEDITQFLSTPSARRATRSASAPCRSAGHFYPRPPRGGRPHDLAGLREVGVFLSTPSARRATAQMQEVPVFQQISIHALREEGDGSRPRLLRARSYFYPRPPRGGRRYLTGCFFIRHIISIHALREEGDMAWSLHPIH